MLARSHRPAAAEPTLVQVADGHKVPVRVFEPAGRPRATALFLGATATRQSYYAPFASYLADHGVRAVTFDYRGIGEARPASLRGYRATMTQWSQLDTRAVLAAQRGRAEPLVLVGHSFGGQQLGLLDDLHEAAGAVMVGVQLGSTRNWPRLTRVRNELLFASVPFVTAALGYMPGRMGLGGIDLPGGVAREWAAWCRHPDYLMGFHEDARARFARYDRPTLFYSFLDDDFAPAGAIKAYLRTLSGAPLVHRRLGPADLGVTDIGHFGFFRPRFQPTLWREALEHIDDVAAGRTPRARPYAADALFEISEEEILEDLRVQVV